MSLHGRLAGVFLCLSACAVPPSQSTAALPAAAPPPAGSAPTALTVRGVPQPGAFTQPQLEALGGEDVPWTFRDQAHVYRGLQLDKLLAHTGFGAGGGGPDVAPRDRRPGWRNVVLATAADGFFAVFTCAELMPEMGPTRAYVVWARDGAPLPGDEGPLRPVVATDRKGSRSARMLVDLEVIDLRPMAAGKPR